MQRGEKKEREQVRDWHKNADCGDVERKQHQEEKVREKSGSVVPNIMKTVNYSYSSCVRLENTSSFLLGSGQCVCYPYLDEWGIVNMFFSFVIYDC